MFFYNCLFKSQDSLDEFKIEEPGVRVVKYISPKNGTEYLCRLNVYSEDDNFENYPEHRPLCVILWRFGLATREFEDELDHYMTPTENN
jgi:hypothetical protein